MINEFKDAAETRESGVIYKGTWEQIKMLHGVSPEKAGELAISAIELLLTGQISSDDINMEIYLANVKEVNQKKQAAYDEKVAATKLQKAKEMRLPEIVEWRRQGMTQAQIAKLLSVSQKTVSNRENLIASKYPELLEEVETLEIP